MQVIDLHLYLKCHCSTGVFQIFKNQLTGFYIGETSVKNGLINIRTILRLIGAFLRKILNSF